MPYQKSTGGLPDVHRRVTGRLPEGYRSVWEGYQSLHKSAEVEIPTYGRDLRVYWWVTGCRWVTGGS